MPTFRIESLLSARQFLSPQIVGDRVYFISDMSGRLSLYAMQASGSVPEALLPPDIALPNPHHFEKAVVFRVLPGLGKILLMLDRDGDENYQPVFLPIDGGEPSPVFGDRFAGQQLYCTECDAERALALFTVDPRTNPMQRSLRVDLHTLTITDLGESLYGNVPLASSADARTIVLSDQYTFGDVAAYLWRAGWSERQPLFGKPIEQRAAGEAVPPNGVGSAHLTPDEGLLFISALFDDRYGLSYCTLAAPDQVQLGERERIGSHRRR